MKFVSKVLAAAIVAGAVIIPMQASAFWDDGNSNTNWNGYGNNNWNNGGYGRGSGNGWGDGSGDADMDGDIEITIKTRGRARGNVDSRGSLSGRGDGSGYNYWNNQYQGYGNQYYRNNDGYAPYGYGPHARPPVAPVAPTAK